MAYSVAHKWALTSLRQLLAINLSSLRDSPYDLRYSAHMEIQSHLWALVVELNSRPFAEFKIRSRIELNWPWI